LVGVAKANAKAKAVAAWSNAGAGAKAEARSESKGERDRGPRITGEESSGRRLVQVVRLLAESHETVQKRRKRREPSETEENETEVLEARGRDENREANARDHGSYGEGTRVPGRPRGGPRRRIVPAPGRRSLDAHEHEGRRTTERPIDQPTRRGASATEQFS
jgi:hypothetical protein